MLDVEGVGVGRLGDDLHVLRLVNGHGGQGAQPLRHRPHEIPGAHGSACGNFVQFAARFFGGGAEPLQIVAVRGQQVGLVGGHDHGAVAEVDAVVFQLGTDGVEILHRVPPLASGHVYNVNEQAAAVDVPEKIVPQTRALSGALNDAGDVRHDEGHALIYINNPQIGIQGRKMVVGNLRVGVGGDGKQGGFAHVGEAHKTHVCQKLQLQNHVPLLPLETGLGKPGNLTGGGGVMGIAPAAPSALGKNEILAGGHVHNDLIRFGVPHDGAPGNLDDQVFAPFARHFSTLTADAGGGLVLALVAEIQKSGQVVVDPENDAAAMSAVAAVRAAGGHIFFPVERHRSIAAPSADDGDAHFIHEHSCTSS